LPGGILEAFGKLFEQNAEVYVYPMSRDAYKRYLMKRAGDAESLTFPNASLIDVSNLIIRKEQKHLYQYLRDNQFIHGLSMGDLPLKDYLASDIRDWIAKGDVRWKEAVPAESVAVIESLGSFS
jgi:hypothetical protein